MKFNNSIIFRSALFLLIFGSIILSYIASLYMEEQTLQRTYSNIQVLKIPPEVEGKDILQRINDFSLKEDSTIYAEILTPEARKVYLSPGGEGEKWVDNGYPSLAPWNRIDAIPLMDIPHSDARQIFFFSGGKEKEEELKSIFDSLGVEYRIFPADEIGFLFSINSFLYTLILVAILIISLIYFGVILNSRSYAVHRLQGLSLWGSIKRDMYMHHAKIWIYYVLVLVVPILLLGFYTSFSALYPFYRYMAFIALFLILISICVHIITVAIIRDTSLVAGLKGKLPVWTILISNLLLRVGIVVIIASLSISAVNITREAHTQNSDVETWRGKEEIYSLNLNAARDEGSMEGSQKVLAQKIRELSKEGKALYFFYEDAGMRSREGVVSDALIYNRAAADLSLDEDTRQILHSLPEKEIIFLVDNKESLAPVGPSGWVPECEKRDCQVVPLGRTNTAFTWEVSDLTFMNRSTIEAPIIAIIPNSDLFMTDRSITAAVTQGKIGIKGYDTVQELTKDPELANFILNASPIDQEWAQRHHEAQREALYSLSSLVVAIFILGAVSVATGFILRSLFSQRLRALHILGLNPLRIYPRILLLDLIVVGALIVYFRPRLETAALYQKGGALEGAMAPDSLAALIVSPYSIILSILVVLIGIAMSTSVMAFSTSKERV